jgi:hypothetical protein
MVLFFIIECFIYCFLQNFQIILLLINPIFSVHPENIHVKAYFQRVDTLNSFKFKYLYLDVNPVKGVKGIFITFIFVLFIFIYLKKWVDRVDTLDSLLILLDLRIELGLTEG